MNGDEGNALGAIWWLPILFGPPALALLRHRLLKAHRAGMARVRASRGGPVRLASPWTWLLPHNPRHRQEGQSWSAR